MTISNRISKIQHVRIGDTLAKFTEDSRSTPVILGRVIARQTNSRGREVVVLDRQFTLTAGSSDRLSSVAFERMSIRRVYFDKFSK